MTVSVRAIRFDANDPVALARFWAGVLGRSIDGDGTTLTADGPAIRFASVDARKAGLGRAHFDLTSTSLADQAATVQRALDLGARHLDIGQSADPDAGHVVLADPEGNEFCVIEPDNNFLAGCGVIGAFNWDGSRAVGLFWSQALGWPLVWDEGEETAIQAPAGGMKIAWGGPPVRPRSANDRLHLELAVDPMDAEVERLESIGATVLRREPGGSVALADPDGNGFWVGP